MNCFLLMVHDDNIDNFYLIDNLSKFNDVFIHVDIKSSKLYESIIDRYCNSRNVFVLKNRINGVWGTVSLVNIYIELLNFANSNSNYTHYTLLSGDSIMIRPIEEFNFYLSSNVSKSYIKIYDDDDLKLKLRVEGFDFFVNSKYRKKIKYIAVLFKLSLYLLGIRNKVMRPRKYYKGEFWCTLSGGAAKLVLSNSFLLSKLKFCGIPDEFFHQTLLMNSNLHNDIIFDNLMLIEWDNRNVNNHPKTLDLESFHKKNELQFFARKYKRGTSLELDKEIDKVI